MNGPRPLPPQRVPTLTEVVEPLYRVSQVAEPATPAAAQPEAAEGRPDGPAPNAGPHGFDEAQLIERVLADLQRQVELMLEYRLREVLSPALTRATETLIREARVELASTLRDVVARAVAQELLRHRGR
jgi:hypothetical protein